MAAIEYPYEVKGRVSGFNCMNFPMNFRMFAAYYLLHAHVSPSQLPCHPIHSNYDITERNTWRHLLRDSDDIIWPAFSNCIKAL